MEPLRRHDAHPASATALCVVTCQAPFPATRQPGEKEVEGSIERRMSLEEDRPPQAEGEHRDKDAVATP